LIGRLEVLYTNLNEIPANHLDAVPVCWVRDASGVAKSYAGQGGCAATDAANYDADSFC
jgi:hypothetical protein